MLARRVRVDEGTFLQGCWLDWDVIQRELVEDSSDLVPHSRLEMAPAMSGPVPTRMLASLPVRLVPGSIPDEPEKGWSPGPPLPGDRLGLPRAAAAAVALLLRGALALSERRGTFVSAVTHELRTPLTTFRLYTEMLDEGMVAGADTQRAYFKTLRGEADRLGHLVENVLAFARLERGRAIDNREIVSPAALCDRLAPPSGFALNRPAWNWSSARLTARQLCGSMFPSSIKSCRTWWIMRSSIRPAPSDRRIHLEVAPAGRWLALTVRDHGPGLQPNVVRRLFRPFSKSAQDAAQSAPGVGLGLALSRRLARRTRRRPTPMSKQFAGCKFCAHDSPGVTPLTSRNSPRFLVFELSLGFQSARHLLPILRQPSRSR